MSFSKAAFQGTYCWTGSGSHNEVLDCLRQLTTLTWWQVMQSGGKGPDGRKRGLAYTVYDDSALKPARPAWLTPDVRICGVRVNQRYRIFGAMIDRVFYLIWFDPDHKIAP